MLSLLEIAIHAGPCLLSTAARTTENQHTHDETFFTFYDYVSLRGSITA